MRKLRRPAAGRGLRALGALVLATASIVSVSPGAAWAASRAPRATATKAPLPGPGRGPAASGQIAYISGGTLEVRNPATGQTTVKITAKTAITATVEVTVKAVVKGSCIAATGTRARNGALEATTVTLVAAKGGKCGGAPRAFLSGGRRVFVGRTTSTTPRRRAPAPANAATAFGRVTAVGVPRITVEGTMLSFSATNRSSSGPKRARSTAIPKAKELTVDVSSKTKYLKTGASNAKSLKVGECATAFGATNSIGAVTATRLSVSPASSGGCGFGGGFFGSGGFVGAPRGANG